MRRAKLLALFASKWIGLFRLARWLTRQNLKILCYHGFAVADEAAFRPQLFIDPAIFVSRLKRIRSQGWKVVPLNEAIDRLYSGRLPDFSVVITIDDGFQSVRTHAVPALAAMGFSASIYVTSYYVAKGTPVFRLLVQYLFWRTGRTQLSMDDAPWGADAIIDLTNSHEVEAAVSRIVDFGESQCDEPRRVELCRLLADRLDLSYDEIVSSRAFHLMTPQDLRDLTAMGMDVQLHTHRHAFPADDAGRASQELADNRHALGQWVPGPFHHFCYPSGDWDMRHWPILDGQGVRSSTTCMPGLNSVATPPHALRRFLDGSNIHPLEFEAALSGFSDLLRGRW